MLKGISPIISPPLLSILSGMGHGDEIILADAFFPGERLNPKIIRADGNSISALLEAIMPLWEFDSYVDCAVALMQDTTGGNPLKDDYSALIKKYNTRPVGVELIDRFAFYERAEKAFAVVMTSTTIPYANILLKKGVITYP